MYFLETELDPRDAFVVALKSAFKKAGLTLDPLPSGASRDPAQVVRLELQVDGVTVAASVPVSNPVHVQEFLEDNPDVLEIAVGDFLVRHFRRARG